MFRRPQTGRRAATDSFHQCGPDPHCRSVSHQIPFAIEQITTLLRERHHLRAADVNDFNVRDMTEIAKAMSSTTELITKLLLCVAMISLVVGGVGVIEHDARLGHRTNA